MRIRRAILIPVILAFGAAAAALPAAELAAAGQATAVRTHVVAAPNVYRHT